MEFVIPKSLLAQPIDTGESDAKLLQMAKQRDRCLALSQGYSSAEAPEADAEYGGGYGSSCYLGPQSINRFPPIVHYPVLNAAETTAQIKRRSTVASVTGLMQPQSSSSRNSQSTVFSSYPPIRKSYVLPATRRPSNAWSGGSAPHDIAAEMTGLRRVLSSDDDVPSPRPANHYQLLLPVSTVRSFFELSAPDIEGKMIQFSKFDKRMILVVNVASGDKNTVRELTQLNDLSLAYGPRGLTILAFPCNQFGGCEPYEDHEIMNCLRYVRPGRNFKPRFHLMSKCEVRGQTTCPVFEYLTQRLPFALDNNRHAAVEITDKRHFENPDVRAGHHHNQTDLQHGYEHEIQDNFEKFIISPEGIPLKRYTAKTRASALAFDIEEVLRKSFPNKAAKSKLNLFETHADHEAKSDENGTKKRLKRRDSRIATH